MTQREDRRPLQAPVSLEGMADHQVAKAKVTAWVRQRTIAVPVPEYIEMATAARSWWTLVSSPYIAEILCEWSEWDLRRRHREASWAVSRGAKEMAERGWSWLSYKELERRRRLTSVVTCGGCGGDAEITHPVTEEQFSTFPATPWARCESCARGAAA